MTMRPVMAMLFVALTSCNAFKQKVQSLSKEDVRYNEQRRALRQYIQAAEDRKDDELEQQQIAQLEIIADSLWYWHPDSGLLSRPGMLKVRYKLKELSKQRQINSNTGIDAVFSEDLIVKENQIHKEHQVNTKIKETKIKYWLLVMLAVLLFLYRKSSL